MISLSQAIETLAKRLAAAQRVSVETAIMQALEEKVRATGIAAEPLHPRDCSPEAVAARRASTDRFVADLAAMPVLDPRPVSEIVDDLNAL